MTPRVSGYGEPRTTEFADATGLTVGSFARVTGEEITTPGVVWVKRSNGWKQVANTAKRLDLPGAPGNEYVNGTIVQTAGGYYRRDSGGSWSTVTIAALDEQPLATVSSDQEQPGTIYVDKRADSAWWRYDAGVWVDTSTGGGGGAGSPRWIGPIVCLESGTVNSEPATLGNNGFMQSVALWTPAVGDLILNAVVYTKVGWNVSTLRFGMYRDADDTSWEYVNFTVGLGKESDDNGFWEQPFDNVHTNALAAAVTDDAVFGGPSGFVVRITDASEPWTVWWSPNDAAPDVGVSHVYFEVCTPAAA